MVHSPGFWATADAASTITLAAMPDSSLNRFIADLMLSDEDGESVSRNLACQRASTSARHGGPRSQQALHIPDYPPCRFQPGSYVISPVRPTVNQRQKPPFSR